MEKKMDLKTIKCSIGVMAYNEEANIGALLNALLKQKLFLCNINEIIVVASGCTDNTEGIVKSYVKKDSKIRLLTQSKRQGKASAINLFLQYAKGDIIVLESADTLPEENTIENLVAPFVDTKIGMTGAHPTPINPETKFIGFTVNLLWRLHHKLAMEHPKLGELVAFRNVIREIPYDTAVDEASIEASITEAGYRLYYASDAIVHNKGPETIRDLLKQRRRIAAGHKHLEVTQNYTVSTTNGLRIAKLLLSDMKWGPRSVIWTIGAVLLECYGRFLGLYDFYVKKKNPFKWDIASSTKNLQS
jgi:cellulose synthase/poly-beta-1,6-N-acetylglucosamine synthase-like glycosyltransferase